LKNEFSFGCLFGENDTGCKRVMAPLEFAILE